ncbi:mechanosensitive ion channel family protein [Halothece sp. PCC 7418]|uniref:mechanosensitive ion channel family protein n=1 Tax=Halothece sp. (strain PCC 7418) TaxID=65093 RepID=UPI0002DF544F|nr:mechanosensitive ion channel domain-containing protein [Halothece sp. PCC 7418]
MTYAQSESQGQSQSSPSETDQFPVTLGDKTLFTIGADLPRMQASQRARLASEEIQRIAHDHDIPLNSIVARPIQEEEVYLISQIRNNEESQIIVLVNKNDAAIAQHPVSDLANEWLEAIQDGIGEYRQQYSLRRRIIGVIALVIATVVLIILLRVTQRLLKTIQHSIDTWRETRVYPIRFRGLVIVSVNEQVLFAHSLISLLSWVLLGIYLVGYFILITFFFPRTENFGRRMLQLFQTPFISIWESAINFLPNLFVILIVIILARFVFKTNKLIFDSLATGRVRWPGFYQDWARPTQKLVFVLIWLVTLAMILPYLPIFESPAIQGLGLLAGALLSLGGAGTISNIIAGYVIIFSRAFQVGDLIAFENYQGFVHKKSILATQIRTFDDEILTIPSDTLQSKTIMNYSAAVHELKLSLAMRTTITLGYDVPWRQVHAVLVEAALATPSVLADPAPFVLQTSLDDFYVTYQLKIFLNEPEQIEQIYSNLLQNVQDYCNAAGIEIMSPHYAAVRDGNQNTIPASYLPKNYTRPRFQIEFPKSFRE